MANNFVLTLDTTAPANPSVKINADAVYATAQLATLTIGTTDGTTTGYQVKIWGDVDKTYDTAVQDTEANSQWITFATSKQVKLTATDGTKTVYVKIRDNVGNVSAQASDSIILDTTLPVVTITGPDFSVISKVAGNDVATIGFTCDSAFDQYMVKVVGSTGAINSSGVQIPVTAGSTNMSGNAGGYPASTVINCTIKGADLEAASAGDGAKIVKVFVKDASGNWSV